MASYLHRYIFMSRNLNWISYEQNEEHLPETFYVNNLSRYLKIAIRYKTWYKMLL